jgi:hypothetical protein
VRRPTPWTRSSGRSSTLPWAQPAKHWVSITCPDCGKKQRAEVRVPDVRARVTAIELLLREGLGRAPQAEEDSTPDMPRTVDEAERMSWKDMKLVFALSFADEITVVREGKGIEELRRRLAMPGGEEQALLRDALAIAPA